MKLLFPASVILICAVALVGCEKKTQPTVSQPVRVTVQPVTLGSVGGSESFSGTVESAESSMLSFSVAGTIADIYVDEGDRVAKGQVLARVKGGDYSNAHNIAMAELHEAQDAYRRLKKLHDADALPEIKWVEIQDKLKQAENAAEITKRTLGDATLRSPVSGVVSRKIASVGQTVIAAEPVIEVVAVSDLMVNVSVPEDRIGSIAEGQKGSVTFSSVGVGPIEGKVTRKSPVADPLTRAYSVKLSIPSTGGKVLPGMVGDVTLAAAPADTSSDTSSVTSGASSVLLPSQAVLLSSDNRTFVWLARGGKALRRFVTVDELAHGGIIVRDGLSSGDSVIVAGMQKVGTGTPVITIVQH